MDLEVLRSQDLPFWGPPPDLGTPSRSGDPLQIWVGTPYGVGPMWYGSIWRPLLRPI